MRDLDEDSTIVTPRLVLHPLLVADAEEMVDVLADPALYVFTGGEPPTRRELRVRYESWVAGSGSSTQRWMNWIVRRSTDGAAIGSVQATIESPDHDSTAIVAWIIGSPWQRQGYATEAATGLVRWLVEHGVADVAAHIHEDHRTSAAVAAAAGLQATTDVVDGEMVWRLR